MPAWLIPVLTVVGMFVLMGVVIWLLVHFARSDARQEVTVHDARKNLDAFQRAEAAEREWRSRTRAERIRILYERARRRDSRRVPRDE